MQIRVLVQFRGPSPCARASLGQRARTKLGDRSPSSENSCFPQKDFSRRFSRILMRRCREHTCSRPQTLVLELTASNRLKSVEGGSHGAHQGIQAIQRRKSDNTTFAPISRRFLCASQKKTLSLENISPLFSIRGFQERFAVLFRARLRTIFEVLCPSEFPRRFPFFIP
jgi:hypothetical protein